MSVRLALQQSIKKRSSRKSKVYHNCSVEWLEWEGFGRRKKAVKNKSDNCTVTYNGKSTYTIKLPSGDSFTKRVGTRGFYFPENSEFVIIR